MMTLGKLTMIQQELKSTHRGDNIGQGASSNEKQYYYQLSLN